VFRLTASSVPPRRRIGWAAAVVGATVFTLLFPTQHYFALRMAASLAERVGRPPPPVTTWTQFFLAELPVWYAWLLVAAPIVWFCRRFPLAGEDRWRNALLHVPASLLAVLAHVMITTAVRMPYLPPPEELGYLDLVGLASARYGVFLITIYLGTVAVYHAGVYYDAFQTRALQASRLQTRLAHAQLDVLKMQLQPHFLFNTLNTIASLMFKDVRAAQSMIVRLSDLLRLSLQDSARHEVPLRDELHFLEQYVDIQRVRFQDRLTVEYRTDPDSRDVLVPRLILQPLVENAIRHGIGDRAGEGRVVVRSSLVDGRLLLEVEDDGTGIRGGGRLQASPEGAGIGLLNTQARLQQLYGEDHDFRIENLEPSGCAVRISIAARREEEAALPADAAAQHAEP
jgi:two-component system, LytTR family, sensor kinase